MPVELVLSVIATDRSGLVQTLAETVALHGGNWIESSMSRLGGEFAGILLVEVPEERLGELEAAFIELGRAGISVIARRTVAPAAPSGREAVLELTGTDQPGIVREISAALARHHASIDELETGVFTASMSGEKLFRAHARIVLPAALSVADLREALEEIAQDIMVEIDIREAD